MFAMANAPFSLAHNFSSKITDIRNTFTRCETTSRPIKFSHIWHSSTPSRKLDAYYTDLNPHLSALCIVLPIAHKMAGLRYSHHWIYIHFTIEVISCLDPPPHPSPSEKISISRPNAAIAFVVSLNVQLRCPWFLWAWALLGL